MTGARSSTEIKSVSKKEIKYFWDLEINGINDSIIKVFTSTAFWLSYEFWNLFDSVSFHCQYQICSGVSCLILFRESVLNIFRFNHNYVFLASCWWCIHHLLVYYSGQSKDFLSLNIIKFNIYNVDSTRPAWICL